MILVNTASSEYYKVVNESSLPAGTTIVEAVFQEADGRVLSVFSKKARGMMVRYGIQSKAQTVDDLKKFTGSSGEFQFLERESSESRLVFVRSKTKAAAAAAAEQKKKGEAGEPSGKRMVKEERPAVEGTRKSPRTRTK